MKSTLARTVSWKKHIGSDATLLNSQRTFRRLLFTADQYHLNNRRKTMRRNDGLPTRTHTLPSTQLKGQCNRTRRFSRSSFLQWCRYFVHHPPQRSNFWKPIQVEASSHNKSNLPLNFPWLPPSMYPLGIAHSEGILSWMKQAWPPGSMGYFKK